MYILGSRYVCGLALIILIILRQEFYDLAVNCLSSKRVIYRFIRRLTFWRHKNFSAGLPDFSWS
jgi:hypothetical protein